MNNFQKIQLNKYRKETRFSKRLPIYRIKLINRILLINLGEKIMQSKKQTKKEEYPAEYKINI